MTTTDIRDITLDDVGEITVDNKRYNYDSTLVEDNIVVFKWLPENNAIDDYNNNSILKYYWNIDLEDDIKPFFDFPNLGSPMVIGYTIPFNSGLSNEDIKDRHVFNNIDTIMNILSIDKDVFISWDDFNNGDY